MVAKRENYVTEVKFSLPPDKLRKQIEKIGHTPTPPYIQSSLSEKELRQKYQTVYATEVGSAAAPTAGFHFTKKLLTKLKRTGIQVEYVTLHVGLGTFAPVKEEDIEDHTIHSEYFEVDIKTIQVGTTTTRVLETLAKQDDILTTHHPQPTTKLFIYPPYRFKFVDAVITNFHLPKSTLLALVSAFVSYPNTSEKFTSFAISLVGKAYVQAKKKKYRFYSFGDSAFIQ